jgi:hypothetical protein
MHDPKVPRAKTASKNELVTSVAAEPAAEVDPIAAMMGMGDDDSDLPF